MGRGADVLRQLGQGGATVSELATPHGMSLPGFMKHLRVLEDAGLVTRLKEGRVVRCELAAEPMQEAAMWLAYYEKFWTAQLDALGRICTTKRRSTHGPELHARQAQPLHHPPLRRPARKSLAGLDRPASAEPLVRSGRAGLGHPGRAGRALSVAATRSTSEPRTARSMACRALIRRSWRTAGFPSPGPGRARPERVSLVTIELRPTAQGHRTGLPPRRFFDQQARDNHERGWTATFAKLDEFLS
jgi:DNA-binding transcriptional ArsR family regulator